ncbi:MAG: hypothetical protein JWN75_636 [Candidatus Saccharibacteria bacterium]|nr:hypothetical protein [Candidatus Saccharibacteria bacterium]
MKRASWNGHFCLGSVVIPVKLYTATMPTGPEFVQVHKEDMAPVKRQLICSQDGKELTSDDIVRAVEHNNHYIAISNIDEVKSHVDRDIIVRQFTDVSHIHSLYYDKPYYLVPDDKGEMAYTTLRNALKSANKIAVVTYSLYGRAHVGIIGPTDGVMILQQLKYASELVDTRDIKMSSLPQPSPDLVDLAVRLIDKYSTDFYLDDYRNEQLDSLRQLIDRTVKGLPAPKSKPAIEEDITPEAELTSKLAGLLDASEKTLS